MSGCIYLITNLINGKQYIGQHNKPDPKTRFRQHIKLALKAESHFLLHNSIRKNGPENFKLEVLCVCLWSALDNLEGYYAEQYETYYWDTNPGYNMVLCGANSGDHAEAFKNRSSVQKGRKKSVEHIAKISESNRGQKRSPEACLKNSIAQKGKKMSDETRAKMTASKKGKPLSEEHCIALSKARKGVKYSEERRLKMLKTIEENGTSRKGIPRSEEIRLKHKERMKDPETRKKISESLTGKVQSEETRAKRSAAMKATLAAKRLIALNSN